jgi:hypothetical protein
MTIQQSILAAAGIIGVCIILSQLMTPYQMASGPALIWRLNRITGEVRECVREMDPRGPRVVSDCR